MEHNIIGWCEIPVQDMARATKFYESVFKCKLDSMNLGELQMNIFPWKPKTIGAGVALVKHLSYKPSKDGALLYFTAEEGITPELVRVKVASGKIIQDKKLISKEIGYMAIIEDTEGNRIALHSMN